MVIFLLLVIFSLAGVVLISLFSPQSLPWYHPPLILDKSEMVTMPAPQTIIHRPVVMEGLAEPEDDFELPVEENVSRLESILHEKNRTIERLQRELAAEKSHRGEFEKVKSILDDEIKNLKTKNKELKSKIGVSNE